MTVRPATYADVFDIAQLLERHVQGRCLPEAARSRASMCIKKSAQEAKKPSARRRHWALVAEAKPYYQGQPLDPVPVGFLYAAREQALDLVENVSHVWVIYLTGKGAAVPLLAALRQATQARILLQSHQHWGAGKAYLRLLRRAVPGTIEVGNLFEL